MPDKPSRYSDRFFAPARPGSAGPDHGGAIDVAANAVEDWAVAPVAPVTRTSFEGWRAPVVIGLVFAVGAAGGAYGWDRWSDHASLVAARSEVDLTTAVISAYFGEGGFQTSVEFINNGSYDVRIANPRFLDDSLTAGPVESFVVPASGRVTRVIAAAADCGLIGDGADWRPTGGMRVSAQPAAGGAREVTLTGASEDPSQLSAIGANCRPSDSLPDVYFGAMRVTVDQGSSGLGSDGSTDGGGGLVVVSHLVLGDVDYFGGPLESGGSQAPILVDGVTAGYRGAFTLTTDPPLPTVLRQGDTITVTWHVDSCDVAGTSTIEDMTLNFAYHAVDDPDASGSLLTEVPTELAIGLLRLANEHCG